MSVAEQAKKLRALVRLLVDASEVVIEQWEADALQPPPEDRYAPVPSLELYEARRRIIGVCGMVVDLVQDPRVSLMQVINLPLTAKALHVAVQGRVADILDGADPAEGVAVEEISLKAGIYDQKLLTVLRSLCSMHIFAEVKGGYFVNTPTSQQLVNNEPLRDLILIQATDLHGAAQKLPTVLFDPLKSRSASQRDTAFCEAYGTPLWEYLEETVTQPDGSVRIRPEHDMWLSGMVAAGEIEAKATYVDYPWDALDARTIVDVGGGVGGMSLHLAKMFPDLRFIVQDRESTIEKAVNVWMKELPSALQTQRVRFMAHDFFTKQPVENADVFLLRFILHDWPDDECVVILSHLRDAMGPDSIILIGDVVVHTTVGSPFLKAAPFPLLPNYGHGRLSQEFRTLGMLALFNAKERTPEELSALAARAKLRVVKTWECRGLTDIVEMRRDDCPTYPWRFHLLYVVR